MATSKSRAAVGSWGLSGHLMVLPSKNANRTPSDKGDESDRHGPAATATSKKKQVAR